MFLRITLFLATICCLTASSDFTIGVIGYDSWVEGDYADLIELQEQTAYFPDDSSEAPHYITYSNTSYSLEGAVTFDDIFVVVGDDEPVKSFEIELIDAPIGMTIQTNDVDSEHGYGIDWTAPLVANPTEFEFTVRAAIYYNEEYLETLEGLITLTVLPSLPRIEDTNFLTQGFRIQDGGDPYDVHIDVYDPDETTTASQLTMESQDPRFTYKQAVGEYWSNWIFEWNQTYSAPSVSEIVPQRFWMRDWDGTQTRWTLGEQDLIIFGYDYETATIEAPLPAEESYFGRALELMNPLAGAPVTAFIQEGDLRQIHIYEQSVETDTWQLKQTLVSPEEDVDFGGSLASQEDLLAVGSPNSDSPLYCSVLIYRRDSETGVWSLLQTLQPDDETQGGNFGGKVTLEQTLINEDQYIYTLMVSADGAASQGDNTGAVWVYEATNLESPVFEQTQIIVPDDAEQDDYFGWPLALRGDLAAIPANEDDDLASDSGAVYVYRRNAESSLWEMEQKLKSDNADYGDLFGERVAISERGIFVSAFRKWQGNTRVGAVYQFEPSESGWDQTRQIRTIEEASVYEYVYWGDSPYIQKEYTLKHFGSSLATEGDNLLICGLRQGYGWDAVDRSIVYQFQWDESANDWEEVRALCSHDSDQPNEGDLDTNFGNAQALALNGETILVGDFGADIAELPDSGRAYSFTTTPLATTPVTDTVDAFFDDLSRDAPTQNLPTDDADGDGWLNLSELYSGTDPLIANEAALWSTHHSDYPHLPTFSYLASSFNTEARPKVMYSRSLEPDSWSELTESRHLPDLRSGDSIQKTIDLSPYTLDDEPLFIRLQYPEVE